MHQFFKTNLSAKILVVLALTITGLMGSGATSRALARSSAYVESSLLSTNAATVSVIVTADTSQNAALAVSRVGGRVTSDLWIIDAVAAGLPAGQVETLAQDARIKSIVQDKGVKVADDPCAGVTPCVGRPGWVTDLREKKVTFAVAGKLATPAMAMSDGSIVSVTDSGVMVNYRTSPPPPTNPCLTPPPPPPPSSAAPVTIVLDGSPYAKYCQPLERYETAPVMSASGILYIAGYVPANATTSTGSSVKGWHVYALDLAHAKTLWSFQGGDVLTFVGLTLGPDGTVYAAAGQSLYALNPGTGKQIWKYDIKGANGFKPGTIAANPVATADGKVYLVSQGEKVATSTSTINPRGHLHALKPADGWVASKSQWTTSLMLKWTFVGDDNSPFVYSPQVGPTGVLYVASNQKVTYAVNPANGARIYGLTLNGNIQAQPELGPDGSLYVGTDQDSLYGLNPDGSRRFLFAPTYIGSDGKVHNDAHFKFGPVLSADGKTVYAPSDGQLLFAVNTATGQEQWRYVLQGKNVVSPGVDAQGLIYANSDAKDLAILNPDGSLLNALSFSDGAKQSPQPLSTGDTLVYAGDKSFYTVGRLPSVWAGTADVEAIGDKNWVLSNPIGIDVGADQVQNKSINGRGITVAVVDSGVYFDDNVNNILATKLNTQFLGQADYVSTNCIYYGSKKGTLLADAFGNPYCWADHNGSMDLFGHGSHVAGILWSNIADWATGAEMGIAPGANILSVRALDQNGRGSYSQVVNAIQFVVANKTTYNIRVMNLSLSATPTTPYFVDPIDRAVEKAWASGIVVVGAAGNTGPVAESITVPGNDPYAITVGSINDQRTPGYWADDTIATYSATGPTLDGFFKPDVLAPGSYIVSFMYNDGKAATDKDNRSAALVLQHPSYSKTTSLFRMSGTSMATAVASGVVALMLQANPNLTPDQVKFRLKYSARLALGDQSESVYNLLQQGSGRIWAPDAVFGSFPAGRADNQDLDVNSDLAHNSYSSDADNAYHYQGGVQRALSDDGSTYLYSLNDDSGAPLGIGMTRAADLTWLDRNTLNGMTLSWNGGQLAWPGTWDWGGGWSWDSRWAWNGGWAWSGRWAWNGRYAWNGRWAWNGRYAWNGHYAWNGRYAWNGSTAWTSGVNITSSSISATRWVGDDPVPVAPPAKRAAPTSATRQPTPPLQTVRAMSVGDLDARSGTVAPGWQATVRISVVDAQHKPLANVAVQGHWTVGALVLAGTCQTNKVGECRVVTRTLESKIKAVTFRMDGLTLPGYAYQPAHNADPDGDSDGTTIRVNQPR